MIGALGLVKLPSGPRNGEFSGHNSANNPIPKAISTKPEIRKARFSAAVILPKFFQNQYQLRLN